MSYLSPAIRIFLIVAVLGEVHGQGIGGFPQMPGGVGMTAADCEQLARMPNSPISVATCKSMMGIAAGVESAASAPGAQPGDDALTCAQIFSELKALTDVGISDANMANSDALVRDGTALATRHAGELSAFMVESAAVGAAVGALSLVLPNFALTAIAAAWQAQVMGMAARAQAEQAPINARINQAMVANAGELMQAMQANPRFARLMQLGINKNCEPPADVK